MKDINEFNKEIEYLGYKGYNLDNIDVDDFKCLLKINYDEPNILNYNNILNDISELDNLSLKQIRNLTKKFYEKYFNLPNVNILKFETIDDNINLIASSKTKEELFLNVNSLIKEINPMDIDIELIEGHSMTGQIIKPIVMAKGSNDCNLRKVYFSHMNLGNQLTLLSHPTMTHEISHLLQEQNIGYAKDYLNKEIISIFLEKVSALEIDKTGKVLKLCERMRLSDIIAHYINIKVNSSKEITSDIIESFMYIKSSFYAEKLFDMYLNDNNKDKYMYQIQDLFDGKITIEDIVNKRNIIKEATLDIKMIKKHIKY